MGFSFSGSFFCLQPLDRGVELRSSACNVSISVRAICPSRSADVTLAICASAVVPSAPPVCCRDTLGVLAFASGGSALNADEFTAARRKVPETFPTKARDPEEPRPSADAIYRAASFGRAATFPIRSIRYSFFELPLNPAMPSLSSGFKSDQNSPYSNYAFSCSNCFSNYSSRLAIPVRILLNFL